MRQHSRLGKLEIICCLVGLLQRTGHAFRTQQNESSEADSTENLCGDKMLKVAWDDGERMSGSFRLDHWADDVELFRKQTDDGCVKVYTADCGKGGVSVANTCDESYHSFRPLNGLVSFMTTRSSKVGKNEVIRLRRGDREVVLERGQVTFWAVDISAEQTQDHGNPVSSGKCGENPTKHHVTVYNMGHLAFEADYEIHMNNEAEQYSQCVDVANDHAGCEAASTCEERAPGFATLKFCSLKYHKLICCRKCSCSNGRRSWPCRPEP